MLAISVLLACQTPAPAVPAVAVPPVAAPWIPPHCYLRSDAEQPINTCYTCHQRARRPHTLDDSELQVVYDFPGPAQINGWTNAGRPLPTADHSLDSYVRTANLRGPADSWGAYFDFDDGGHDRSPSGDLSGWRAYTARPFPGFTPADGSWGDVLIRLPKGLRAHAELNLAILDAVLHRRDIAIPPSDERTHRVDLDLDGHLGTATQITYRFSPRERPMRWVGTAEHPPTPGLFPVGTEFLHSVRYLDPTEPVQMASRLKELRHLEKTRWQTMAELAAGTAAEEAERQAQPDQLEPPVGDPEQGLATGNGWRLRAWIEAKDGTLRPQTTAELTSCVGCHGGIGRNTDAIFSYERRAAWGHSRTWSGPGDAIRADGRAEVAVWKEATGRDLALPSPDEARALNLAYHRLVQEQSFERGRDLMPGQRFWETVKPLQPTGNRTVIAPAWMRQRTKGPQ